MANLQVSPVFEKCAQETKARLPLAPLVGSIKVPPSASFAPGGCVMRVSFMVGMSAKCTAFPCGEFLYLDLLIN